VMHKQRARDYRLDVLRVRAAIASRNACTAV
jgi:hypothetical protein